MSNHSLQLDIKSFSFEENSKSLLHNIKFSLHSGKILLIKGKSGCGKTTLLNVICTIIPKVIEGILNASVKIDNEEIADLPLNRIAQKISLMMQEPDRQLLLPNVEMELAFAPENLCLTQSEISSRISEVVELLNLQNILKLETHKLSYGQKKLTTFASLITLSPIFFLLDEPAAGLASQSIDLLRSAIKHLKTQAKGLIITDHTDTLFDLADSTIDLDNL
ncbi:MAG: ABC transporter ATP-binding protein [Candidatus Cloacimonetes bacterium]|nr:ABC transporter ATP-binding protein [Candidatus Cloacimonadota bacterium]